MQSDPKKNFFAFFFFIATLMAVGYYHFSHEQQEANLNIDTTLEKAVQTAHILIGNSYHDRVLKSSPNEVQNAYTANTLTTLAHTVGVDRIYSVILDPAGKLRLTSSNLSRNEMNRDKEPSRFFDLVPENIDILQAFKSNQIVWATEDSGEKFKTIYAPFTTSGGERYVIAAGMDTSSIQKFSNASAFKAITILIITFLGALPSLLIYRNTLQKTAALLREKVTSATNELREVNEILENKVEEKTKQLISQSFEDPMTGLPNRHRLQYEMDRKPYHTLLIINLHNFREINDFFGVHAGDDLLRQMGHWLQMVDFHPYRLSGDEFALLLEQRYSRDELEELVTRLLHRLSDHPFSIGEENVSLNVTIGIDAGPDISLAHADIALHEAKENSQHYAFYDSEHNVEERYKSNLAISKKIHAALNGGRVICFYQPVASLKTGQIEKYETLVRMIDEHANIIPPADFLKIAQKTRLYPQITQAVIEQACTTFQTRNEEFSVNLSIRDILDLRIVRFIEEMIVQTDTAHRIIFEILESEGVENFESVIRFTTKMKKLGAKIAVDDFGTGYSNIENILKLDVDYVKIDGSLICNIMTDPKHMIVVESIKNFASRLGAKTIAEFVSSEEIYTKLQSIGIDYAQGYYVGKPGALSL